MNDTLIRRVGQKLHFARIHLRELEKMAEPAATQRSRQIAYTESFVYHLSGALRCHLLEVARFYKVDALPAAEMESMLSLLAEQCRVAPEINELRILAARGDSWLKRLTVFHQASERNGIDSEPAREAVASHLTLIELQASDDQRTLLPAVAECAHWLDAAIELIERQRQGMEQW